MPRLFLITTQQEITMKLTLGEYRERYSSLLCGADRTTVEQAGTVASYITNIANAMERSAESFDLLSLDGFQLLEGKLKIAATNTTEINKKLMEFFSLSRETKELPPSVDDKLSELAKTQAEKESRVIQSKIQEYLNAMQQRMTEYHNCLRAYTDWKQKELAVAAGSDALRIRILDSLKHGISADEFFRFQEVRGSSIILRTVPFRVNYFDAENNINDFFETGPFEVHVSLDTGISIKFVETDSCVKSGGYIHPHISNGAMCLGNGSASYKEAAGKLDIATMLRISKAILTTYNPDSPYRAFRSFKADWETMKKKREVMISEQAIKKAYEERVSSQETEEWIDEFCFDVD